MGKTNVTPKDLFIQYKDISVLTDGADSTTLVSADFDTGLSLRGGIAWLIHMIACQAEVLNVTAEGVRIALSTLKGKTAMPRLHDKGCIDVFSWVAEFLTSGMFALDAVSRHSMMPPLPLAAPNISLYVQTPTDVAAARGTFVDIRIGYTTMPLDAPIFQEIAEVWGW
jgi:hypothetical protein